MKKCYKGAIDKRMKSGEANESNDKISAMNLSWFDAMHAVMKNRAITNPPHFCSNRQNE